MFDFALLPDKGPTKKVSILTTAAGFHSIFSPYLGENWTKQNKSPFQVTDSDGEDAFNHDQLIDSDSESKNDVEIDCMS